MEQRPMMLSELLGNPVRDAEGQSAGRLHDIVVRIDGADPPRVVGLLLCRKRAQLFLPIAAVETLDARAVVVTASAPPLAPFERRPREVLLGRDVMDSQVISLAEPRVVRVNDVVLAGDGAAWEVSGVDIGARATAAFAAARVASPRRARARTIPWARVELLSSEVPGGLVPPDHRRLARLHPADIARIADAVPRAQATEIVASLDDELAADTMEEMIDAKQADVIEELEPERAADILDRMAPWPTSPRSVPASSRLTRAMTPAASPRTHRSARPTASACCG